MNRKRTVVVIFLVLAVMILLMLLGRRKPSPPVAVLPIPAVKPTAKLVFDPTTEMAIARDYDQRGSVFLRNDDDHKIKIRVVADPPDDLFAGFVGRGTDDWYEQTDLEIGPGETWKFPFIVHANRAVGEKYEVPIRVMIPDGKNWVVAGEGMVKIKVAKPQLKLKTRWIEPESEIDRARLVRVLEIYNMGVNVPDFTISTTSQTKGDGGALTGRVRMQPWMEQGILAEREVIRIRVWPRLYPTFKQLTGTLYLHGHLQTLEVPYEIKLPTGQQLFITTSRSSGMSGNGGKRCTNAGSASYGMPPTSGTPASGSGGGAASGGGVTMASPNTSDEDEKDKDEDDDVVWSDNPFATGGDHQTAEQDQAIANTIGEILDDVAEGTLPASATGSDTTTPQDLLDSLADKNATHPAPAILNEQLGEVNGRKIISPDDPRHPDYERRWLEHVNRMRTMIRDSIAATMETTAHIGKNGKRGVLITRHGKKNGENTTGFVFQNFGFGIQQGGSTRKAWSIPVVRGKYSVRQPTLGSGPNDEMVAAYGRPTKQGGSVIEVRDVQSGKKIILGDPTKASQSPKIVRTKDRAELVYLEDGKIKGAQIKPDFTAGKPEVLLSNEQKIQELVQARPNNQGKPVILARTSQQEMILVQGQQKQVIEGTGGDFRFNADGKRTVVVRRGNGAIEQVDESGKTIAQLAPPSKANGPPTLLRTKAGSLRAIFHQNFGLSSPQIIKSQLPIGSPPGSSSKNAADNSPGILPGILGAGGTFQFDFKDGKWGPPMLVPQPEQPVTAAAVAVEVSLPYAEAHYKKQNVRFYLNGYKIGELKNRVPNGRYVFQVPPQMLRYQAPWRKKTVQNNVSMKIQGMGKGNFALTDRAEIYTRHALVQEYLVAPTHKKATELAQQSSPELTHASPDLMLTSNDWELPRGVKPGDTVTAKVGLMNVGDKVVPAGTLIAKGVGKTIGQASYKMLYPFEQAKATIDITMPRNWKQGEPLQVTITSQVPGDLRPKNHRLTFVALRNYIEPIAGPKGPSKVTMTNVTGVESLDLDKKPYEIALNRASMWYRIKAPSKGQLQIDLINAPQGIVLSMDLFSEGGHLLARQKDRYLVRGQWIYLRIGLRPQDQIPNKAKIKIGWETLP